MLSVVWYRREEGLPGGEEGEGGGGGEHGGSEMSQSQSQGGERETKRQKQKRTDREFVSKFDAFEEQVRGALAPPRARRAAARTLPPALCPAVRAVCAHRSRRGCVPTVRQD